VLESDENTFEDALHQAVRTYRLDFEDIVDVGKESGSENSETD
jgi:hypothetical protein